MNQEEKIKVVTCEGQTLITVNLVNCVSEEALKILKKFFAYLKEIPNDHTVNILFNIENMKFDPRVVEISKEIIACREPHLGKVAIVGVDPEGEVILEAVMRFSGRYICAFATTQQALEWFQDRRIFPRSCEQIGVEYSLVDDYDQRGATVTDNISLGGILFKSLYPFRVDDNIALKIYLPVEELPLNVTGRVIWVEQSEESHATTYPMGIEFEAMPDEDYRRLCKYVSGGSALC